MPILHPSSQTASVGPVSELNHLGRHINVLQKPGFEHRNQIILRDVWDASSPGTRKRPSVSHALRRLSILIICIQVVEKDSAILGFPTEQRIPISANHREIVHFTNIESQKFDIVKTALQELRDGGPMNVQDLKTGTSLEVQSIRWQC